MQTAVRRVFGFALGALLLAGCAQPQSTPAITPTSNFALTPMPIVSLASIQAPPTPSPSETITVSPASIQAPPTPTRTVPPGPLPASTPSTEKVISPIPDCPADPSAPLFEVSPIQLSDLLEVVPLGNLNPPGHTFPTDHLYFIIRLNGVDQSISDKPPAVFPVFAPGRIWITQIDKKQYARPSSTDYSLRFQPCKQFGGYFHHVQQLSENLLIRTGPFEGSGCDTYSDGSIVCRKHVMIEMEAGEIIGVNEEKENLGLDFGAMDSRVPPLAYANPARYWSSPSGLDPHPLVCVIDYYSPDVRDQLRGRLGGNGGQAFRTVEPICGEVEQDEPGTAQGNWFLRGTVGTPPLPYTTHLALVRDNIDPLLGAFSVGAPVPGLGPFTENFAPQTSGGRVNLDFSQVTADGNIYCYDSWHNRSGEPVTHTQPRIVLIQLTGATTLRIEKQDVAESECGTGPWAFQANYVDFER